MEPETVLTPEILVPRLGDTLVETGIITREVLDEALLKQKDIQDSGNQPPLLGELLIGMGMLTRSQLDTAVTEQILQLLRS